MVRSLFSAKKDRRAMLGSPCIRDPWETPHCLTSRFSEKNSPFPIALIPGWIGWKGLGQVMDRLPSSPVHPISQIPSANHEFNGLYQDNNFTSQTNACYDHSLPLELEFDEELFSQLLSSTNGSCGSEQAPNSDAGGNAGIKGALDQPAGFAPQQFGNAQTSPTLNAAGLQRPGFETGVSVSSGERQYACHRHRCSRFFDTPTCLKVLKLCWSWRTAGRSRTFESPLHHDCNTLGRRSVYSLKMSATTKASFEHNTASPVNGM
ncbi:hypothetical protein QBC35DRAFT_471115 [Podospora australis]|uniref:Uncharacterized protein n=1 Tax=Podospora australis TaxID=1536484 RepID=A0AAN6WZE2_9PEZI|nr:hypothetical protein QBC35DRAFT_471115 [Podospora australis]